jgi:hypothetical protein
MSNSSMDLRLPILSRLTDSLSKSTNVSDALTEVLKAISEADFARCRVYLIDDEDAFVGVAQQGLPPETAEMFLGITIQAEATSALVKASSAPQIVTPQATSPLSLGKGNGNSMGCCPGVSCGQITRHDVRRHG